MRVLVCGGRDYADKARVFATLDALHATTPITCIIDGCARGADALGATWAVARNIPQDRFPADWNTHGTAAGPIRNAQMLSEGKPDRVVAFPGGTGTANMIALARKAGVLVQEFVGFIDGREQWRYCPPGSIDTPQTRAALAFALQATVEAPKP